MNLALNARDAMPSGGRISIAVDVEVLPKETWHEIPPGTYVRLVVSDTGQGMDENTMDHLFEPFFTTKGMGQGTGLGLSIVYGIVKQSGGHIEVESGRGEGSTFTIYLPRVPAATDVGAPAAEEEGQRGSGSILVVEDEVSVRSLVRKILEGGGYTVFEAESGEKAIEICRCHDEGFDLLLTDIVLTGIRGGEVAERVRRFFPEIRVIYMTGYVDKADLPLNEANAPIVPKPFSAVDLLAQVKSILQTSPQVVGRHQASPEQQLAATGS
jgi:two-component system cell cycle sensor histidine kinase/response regulator CckA